MFLSPSPLFFSGRENEKRKINCRAITLGSLPVIRALFLWWGEITGKRKTETATRVFPPRTALDLCLRKRYKRLRPSVKIQASIFQEIWEMLVRTQIGEKKRKGELKKARNHASTHHNTFL